MSKRRSIYFAVVFSLCLALVLIGFSVSGVKAGENYGTRWVGGQEDLYMGFVVPPGVSVLSSYTVGYDVTKLKDNAGRNATLNVRTPFGTVNGPLNFKSQTLGQALRYDVSTKLKLLGGNFAWHVVVPTSYSHVAANADMPMLGNVPVSSNSKTGLGDIELAGVIGWHHGKTFHHFAGLTVVAPTGAYDETDPASPGRNYWSFNPLWSFSYIGDKDSPIPGLEVGSKLMYWFNTINTATSYTSGQEFAADYLVAQHLGKAWTVGVNGTFLYQTTDDKQYGRAAVDPFSGLMTGVRGKYFSIGPMIAYQWQDLSNVAFKVQWDVWEQNRPEGVKVWLRYSYPFGVGG
jgi:hypothetical protein